MIRDVCVNIGNRNGYSSRIGDTSRLDYLFRSIFKHIPNIEKTEVLFSDNKSNDKSCEYFEDLNIGKVINRPLIKAKPGWLQTTLNNQLNISNAILQTNKKFFWNVENDSYFFRKGFIDQAIDILNEREDIAIIHLRYWTDLDKQDWVGIPKNISRYVSSSETSNGVRFYELEQRNCDVIWVDVTKDILKNFSFDEDYDPMNCKLSNELKVGNIRLTKDNRYERLLNEHWNTYTSHGYIARVDALRFIIERYQPLAERSMSWMVRKHFKAAKLEQDAFFSFGWNTRIKNVSKEDIEDRIRHCENNFCSSIKEIGTFINPKNVKTYYENQSCVSTLR